MRWIFFILFFSSVQVRAQDLQTTSIKKPSISLDGNLSLGLRSYNTSNSALSRNSDFGFLANARLNLRIYSFSIPFSYRLGDQLNLPQLPSFRYWGLSPKYKSFQMHIGHRSLRFSDHTLSGIQTYGIGAAFNYKKFKLQVSRGVLDRQRPERIIYNSRIQSRKEKRYLAGSLQLGTQNKFFKYALLSAHEKESNIDSIPARYNMVHEVEVKHTLWHRLYIGAHTAVSYVEPRGDRFISLKDSTDRTFLVESIDRLGVSPGIESKIGFIFGLQLGFKLKSFDLSLDLDHIDRSFETFGRNFQITDVRTYTVKNRFQLFQNKLIFTGRVGLQQNNLMDEKASNSTRWISNFNLTSRLNSGHLFTAYYSNFNLEKENLYIVGQDSISFSFNARTIGASAQFIIGKNTLSGSVTHSVNSNGMAENLDQNVTIAAITYQQSLFNQASSVQLGARYNSVVNGLSLLKQIGVNLGVTYSHQDKLETQLSYTPHINREDNVSSFMTHMLYFNARLRLKEKHSLFASAYCQVIDGPFGVRDYQARVGYTFRFDTRKVNNLKKDK